MSIRQVQNSADPGSTVISGIPSSDPSFWAVCFDILNQRASMTKYLDFLPLSSNVVSSETRAIRHQASGDPLHSRWSAGTSLWIFQPLTTLPDSPITDRPLAHHWRPADQTVIRKVSIPDELQTQAAFVLMLRHATDACWGEKGQKTGGSGSNL